MESGYYKTKESVEENIQLAKEVNGGNLIEKLKGFLPSGSKVLELGSGPGTDWKILDNIYNVVGSDNSSEFLKHLETSNPNGRFLELGASSLQTGEMFDGIYSNKVLHHLNDDELTASIKRQSEVLAIDGIICHSFWKGEGTEIFKGLYVNYHTDVKLRKFFEPNFEVLLLESYAEFEEGDSLLLIAKRK